MVTLIYGDGTKTILLRMKWRFQIYTSFPENIKDSYKKLPESFFTLANNRSLWAKTLEYEIDSIIFELLTW